MEIRDLEIRYKYAGKTENWQINKAKDAVEYMKGAFEERPFQEQLYAILLDTQLRPIGRYLVSLGTVSQSLAQPADLFRAAILGGASSFVMMHNHPSGAIEPSKEDLHVARQFTKAGVFMGIEMLDFIIIGREEDESRPVRWWAYSKGGK